MSLMKHISSPMCRREEAICYGGFALYWAWVYLSFNSDISAIQGSGSSGDVFLVHLVSCGTAAVVFLAIAALFRVFQNPRPNRVVGIASVALITGGTALYSIPFADSSTILNLVGSMVSGIGASVVVVSFGVSFASLSGRTVARVTAACFFAAAVIFALVTALPGALAGFGLVVVAGGCGLCAAWTMMRLVRDKEASVSHELNAVPGRPEWQEAFKQSGFSLGFIAGLAILMFAYGGLRAYLSLSSEDAHPGHIAFFLASAIGALAMYAESRLRKKADVKSGYRLALPLIVFSLALVSFFGSANVAMASVVGAFASTLIESMTWVVIVNICRSSHLPALLMFALGRATVHVGMFAGELCGMVAADAFPTFSLVCICAIVVVASFMFVDRGGEAKQKVADSEKGAAKQGDAAEPFRGDAHGELLSRLADERGLSPREKEVFLLWSTGFGSRYIEEKLCIAPATVKTHVRHIYGKFGVKSKAELMSVIDQSEA